MQPVKALRKGSVLRGFLQRAEVGGQEELLLSRLFEPSKAGLIDGG